MSSPPPVAARAGMPSWLKWLLGIIVALFLLVGACCVGGCLMGRSFFGDLFGKIQRAEEQQALARAAEERIEIIDLEFPPRLPSDVALAELTDDDVSRYVRVRTALAPQAAAFQTVVDGAVPKSSGTLGVARGVVGLIGASLEAGEARKDLLIAAEPALRAEGMGPTDLARLAEIVEWRYLQRPEALFLGLPEAERKQLLQMRMEEAMLSAWAESDSPPGLRVNNRTKEDAVGDLAGLRERIAVLEERARGTTALSGTTLAALQPRRGDLESLSPAGLQALAPLTGELPLVDFTGGKDSIHIRRDHSWGTSSSDDGADGEPAPEPLPAQPTSPGVE